MSINNFKFLDILNYKSDLSKGLVIVSKVEGHV